MKKNFSVNALLSNQVLKLFLMTAHPCFHVLKSSEVVANRASNVSAKDLQRVRSQLVPALYIPCSNTF